MAHVDGLGVFEKASEEKNFFRSLRSFVRFPSGFPSLNGSLIDRLIIRSFGRVLRAATVPPLSLRIDLNQATPHPSSISRPGLLSQL